MDILNSRWRDLVCAILVFLQRHLPKVFSCLFQWNCLLYNFLTSNGWPPCTTLVHKARWKKAAQNHMSGTRRTLEHWKSKVWGRYALLPQMLSLGAARPRLQHLKKKPGYWSGKTSRKVCSHSMLVSFVNQKYTTSSDSLATSLTCYCIGIV